ncbi:MAG: sulfatase, partial [Flavobacteriaceae bacterium]
HKIDGHSFVESMEKEQQTTDSLAFSYYNNGISMRTPRYRFTKYFREEKPVIELYDHQLDPLETRNIAAQEPEQVEALLPLLEKVDPGLYSITPQK